ncbi:MAG: SBBP repeat-containing protein [Actinomycetota bacterium]|nr:SBBP repeat-containing protein [Actinomycetota bacterium]
MPLRFEANRGQAAGSVDFLARGPGYTMALGRDGAVLSLTSGKGSRAAQGSGHSAVVGMHLVGASTHPVVSGTNRLPGASNYLVGRDRSQWHTGVPSFARVRYQGVYPGVDMVYRGNQRELEYDLVVAPKSDPARIALGFRGSQHLSITASGDLLIHARGATIRQRRPVIYQGEGTARRSVPGHYVLKAGGHQVGFQVASYDRSKPLVIDPSIAYSTFLGGYNTSVSNGSSQDTTNGITVDSSGNAYVVGFTDSIPPTPFPTTGGALQTSFGGGLRDGFVTKLNPAGTAAVYSTYLGGSAEDRATDVEVNAAGNAFVSGFTASTNFPTQNPIQAANGGGTRDAFVAELNPQGTGLVYSTYLGGSGTDTANRLALDSSGAVYLGGTTAPATNSVTDNFPTTAGAFQTTFGGGAGPTAPSDAFVTKINSAGSAITYSTFLGGDQPDTGASVAVDSAGSAYVAGATRSNPFPTTAGAFDTTFNSASATDSDAYVTKLNPAGSALAYSTYVGGTRFEGATGVAVDSAGSAYITGETNSTNFPTANANQPNNASAPGPNDSDSFVTKLNAAGTGLAYSTYNGSNTYDTGTDIAVDPSGNAYAVGNTLGSFPLKNAVQVRTGDYDSYLTKFDANGAVSYSTIFGGGARDFGQAVAVDGSGNAYIGGRTDYFSPDSFPTKSAFQPQNGGFADAWVAKISPNPTSPLVNSLRSRGGPVGGGTPVVINGTGFTGASAVSFGGTTAASFVVNSDTQITAVSPAHAAGKVNVIVTAPSGNSPDNPVTLFEYAEGVWKLTGSLSLVHYDQQMKLLNDGRVLLIGGQNAMFGTTIAANEIYNPVTRTWTSTGDLNTPRSAYTATRLDGPACRSASPATYCGDILVAGGSPNSASSNTPLNTAETYHPASGTWTPTTGNLNAARDQQAATLLDGPECHAASPPAHCGKVLVTGGFATPATLSSAELYDPATRTFSTTGSMLHTARLTTSVLLPNGKVLMAGGTGSNPAAAEIYDPAAGTWSTTGSLNIGRQRGSLVVLANGKVLAAAGTPPGDPPYLGTAQQAGDSAELFDPAAGTWTLLPDRLIGAARNNHDSAVLPSGKVLLADGGRGGLTSELFDPTDNKWRSAGLLNISRGSGHPQTSSYDTVVLSSDPTKFAADSAVCGSDCGKVLVAGNSDDKTADLYTPAPRVDGLAPSTGTGAGGTSVTITGQGFTHNVTSVLFGGTPAGFTVDSYGQIRAVAPAGSGSVAITVVNEGGSATSAGSFAYQAVPGSTPNPGGNPPGSTPTPDLFAPGVSSYGLTNNPFTVGGSTPTFGTAAAKKKGKKHKKGTTFRYTLSEAATVKISISQRLAGRRKGKLCVAPTRSLRKAKKCTRVLSRGTLTRVSHVGANSVAFSGRIGSKKLSPGSYLATLIATDAAKNSSTPKTISFTIVKR